MEPTYSSSLHAALEAEHFKFVAAITDYAIYLLSPQGIVTSWNAGAQRFKGYASEEIIGQHFSRFYTEEDKADGLPARALHMAETSGKFEGEGWRVRKDGTRFWAHVVIDAIRNGDGELIGFAKVTRDITERREAAENLERSKEALFHAQKLEALGKLTGGIAHDFNNLLNVIISGMDILAAEGAHPANSKVLDSMRRAATRGAALTGQLLAFARLQTLRQEKTQLNHVISSFEAVLRGANKESIAFRLELYPELPLVMIDSTQFEAGLLNLVINARDAVPNEGGSITVRTELVRLGDQDINSLAAGRYVKITVEDNGMGMTPEVAARAVEPFYTTKEVGKGTGMGLSQVYGLLQQSGGDMVINTAPGQGCAVSLYLPALDDAPDGLPRTDSTGNDKALVVDDQPEVLMVAVELFRSLGYDVLSANNGSDALETLRRTPDIDVLFSDIVMPGISGIELGQEARQLVPGIKVILASGYAEPTLRAQNASVEDFQFVKKPYRIAEIAKNLRMAEAASLRKQLP